MKSMGKWSRRSMVSAIGSLGISAIWGKFFSQKAHASNRKAQAFALIGDRWHNFHYIRTALMKTLVKDLGLSIDFNSEPTLLSKETLEGYRLLIVLCDGMLFPGGYTT